MAGSKLRQVASETPRVFSVPATVFLIAALVVTVLRAAIHFDDGIWLVAYLFLVGFLAQYLLGAAQSAITGGSGDGGAMAASAEFLRLESLLWNAGSVLVPLSVMTGGKAGVLAGSAALGFALILFGRTWMVAPGGSGRLRACYGLLILFMAVSVITGLVLAWGRPWV